MVLNTQRERQWNSINMYKNNGDTPCDEEPSIISNDQEKVFKINKNKINSNIITDSRQQKKHKGKIINLRHKFKKIEESTFNSCRKYIDRIRNTKQNNMDFLTPITIRKSINSVSKVRKRSGSHRIHSINLTEYPIAVMCINPFRCIIVNNDSWL